MIALRNHYSGEANTSRRIAVAKKTRDTLHYKSERAMSFSSFLDKLQKMFNIFDEEGEAISKTAKVCLLLKKVEHPQLQDAIGALRVPPSTELLLLNAQTISPPWSLKFRISNLLVKYQVLLLLPIVLNLKLMTIKDVKAITRVVAAGSAKGFTTCQMVLFITGDH
jgi:hypothetical protein